MRRGLFLLGILLSFSLAAAAQGPAGVGAGSMGWERVSREQSPSFPGRWRFSMGYQFSRINLTGTPFDMEGINGSVSRLFNNWIGLEGQAGFGYGNPSVAMSVPNLRVKSIFAAAGPRLVHRGHGRLELWAHGLVGMEHFQFNQTVGELNSNTGLAGVLGGGADYRLSRNLTITGEADAVGTRFFGGYQRHFQAVSSLVIRY